MSPRFFLIALALGTVPMVASSCGGDASTGESPEPGAGGSKDASVDGDGAAGASNGGKGGAAGGAGMPATGGMAGTGGSATGGAAGTGAGGAAGAAEGGAAGAAQGGAAGAGERGAAGAAEGGAAGAGEGGAAQGGAAGAAAGGAAGAGNAGAAGSSEGGAAGQGNAGSANGGSGGAVDAGIDAPSKGGSSNDGGQNDAGLDASMGCSSNLDCLASQFCSKASCQSPKGVCLEKPKTCDSYGVAVCGCDGVNYWNDCLRQREGQEASMVGECKVPKMCGGIASIPCPGTAVCAFLFDSKSQCAIMDPAGECWMLPDTCPSIVIGGQLRDCGSSTQTCFDPCTAMKKTGMFYKDSSCPV